MYFKILKEIKGDSVLGIEKIEKITAALVDKFASILKRNKTIRKQILYIVTAGSAGRGEATFHRINDKIVYSDVDLIVITKYYNPFLNKKIKIISDNALWNSILDIDVNISSIGLMKKHRTIFLYDLVEKGKFLYGNRERFAKQIGFKVREIPKYEGLRLILNRIAELMNSIELTDREILFKEDFAINYIKTIISCGEALILYEDNYKTLFLEKRTAFNKSELISKFPGLKKELNRVLDWKFNPNFDIGKIDRKSLIKKAADFSFSVLGYCFKRYFFNDCSIVSNASRYLRIKSSFLENICYSSVFYLSYTAKGNPRLGSLLIPVKTYSQISLLLLFMALGNKLDRRIIRRAQKNLEKIAWFELDLVKPGYKKWNCIKDKSFGIWKQSFDTIFYKDPLQRYG